MLVRSYSAISPLPVCSSHPHRKANTRCHVPVGHTTPRTRTTRTLHYNDCYHKKSPLVHQRPRYFDNRAGPYFLYVLICHMPYEWQKCYVSLVENLDVKDVDCIKYSLSKGIGLGIVVGGSIMKVPQLVLSTLRSLRPLPRLPFP